MKERERSSLTNGAILLEDLIASSNGKCNPIRHFSADELIIATNNFDKHRIIQDFPSQYDRRTSVDELDDVPAVIRHMYEGFFDDRPIIVKKFTGILHEDEIRSHAIRDIVITTQMSNHKNVLKLTGCCLEFPIPALVHEYTANGALNDKGGFGAAQEFLPWKIRLQISKELANALTYLHTALLRPVIHRDIRPSSIFLDHNFVPKFCNFSISITIPPKQSHVGDNLKGTFDGYCDPEYLKSGSVTEKSDVYSFGVFLLVYLFGRRATPLDWKEGSIIVYARQNAGIDWLFEELVDGANLRERGGDGQARQIKAFLALALACTLEKGEARPDMIDVAKELMRIEKLI
jgi:serine/threonine protein kinase